MLLLRRQKGGQQNSDTFIQTLQYAEAVASTPVEDDLKILALAISEKLNDIELERRSDRKKCKLHRYEIACLSNFVKTEDTSVEEVLCWIPSLYSYNEDEIMRAIKIVVEEKQRLEKS